MSCRCAASASRSVSARRRRPPRDDIPHAASRRSSRRGMPTAILIVCGGLMTLDVTPLLEARCGVPVVSSMPAALRKAAHDRGRQPRASGRLWPCCSAARRDNFYRRRQIMKKTNLRALSDLRGRRRGMGCRQRAGARLSLPHRHRRGADRGRRRGRHHRADFRRAASGEARAAVRGREPHRGRRHHRHELCRQGAAGRLHAAADGKLRAAGEVDLQDSAVRPAEATSRRSRGWSQIRWSCSPNRRFPRRT